MAGNYSIVSVLFDDVYSPKPKSLYYGVGMTHLPAVQNLTDVSAMDPMTIRKCSLTSLTFKCHFEQNKRVVVIKYARSPA